MKPYFDATLNIATREQAHAAVHVARGHAENTHKPMQSSAQACVGRAAEFLAEENYGFAHEWACMSLEYSVGIMHPDYIRLQNERR